MCPRSGAATTWALADLPDWQQETDADIFEAIETSVN